MATEPASGAVTAAKFVAFLNGAYQADREASLDRRHRWLMFGVIILGASAVVEALPVWARTLASITAAALAAADLVFDLSVRARTASFLRKSYFDIAADLESGEAQPTKAHSAMLRLAAEEEPPYMAAHALAENWATGAVYGFEKPRPCRVGWWRKLTRHMSRQTSHDFSVVTE